MATAKKAAAKKPAAKKKPRKPGQKPVAQSALDVVGTQGICDHIVNGLSYRQIAGMYGVGLASLDRWMSADAERSQACARAREQASQAYDELALEGIEQATDVFALAKAKEAAVHLRWRAKAVNPKRYGDKTTLSGDAENPLVVQGAVTSMSEAALLAIASGKQA